MKKVFLCSLMTVLILAIALSGCGSPPPKPKSNITVGFVTNGTETPWIVALNNSIISEASKRGIQLIFSGAQQNQADQIAAIRSLIAQEVNVIGFIPIIETGWDTILGEANAAGIPIILLDMGVSPGTSLWNTKIELDFDQEAQKAGIWVRDHSGIASGNLKIAEIQGVSGSACATDRAAGFRKIIAAEKIIISAVTNFTKADAKAKMAIMLDGAEGNSINLVYAHCDEIALGAIEAIEEHFGPGGKKPGIDIKIVSIDAVKGALAAILAGKSNCTVQSSPLFGPPFFDAAETLAKGGTVSSCIKVCGGTYTSANVTQALINSWPY